MPVVLPMTRIRARSDDNLSLPSTFTSIGIRSCSVYESLARPGFDGFLGFQR